MNVMTALVLAALIGLATAWVKSDEISKLLDTFQKMVLELVKRVLLPVLPVFIAANFCILSYQGSCYEAVTGIPLRIDSCYCLSFHLAVIALFHCSCLLKKKNSWQVLKYYDPAYLTALGTMSSAATLGVALECARKSPILRKEISDVTIPLFANIHLCGSILTETVFVLTVSQMLYGSMPSILQITLFILLLGLFAIGAPGVPGEQYLPL